MRWTKYIGCAITLVVVYIVMSYLYSRNNVSTDSKQNEFCYVIKLPRLIKIIYSLVFFIGIFLFLFFLIIKIKWGGGVTNGHLSFALILSGIGIVIMLFAGKWKVVVNEGQFSTYSLIHGKREYCINEIEEVEEDDDTITLYMNQKKIVTIDRLSENYDRLINTLKRYDKIK